MTVWYQEGLVSLGTCGQLDPPVENPGRAVKVLPLLREKARNSENCRRESELQTKDRVWGIRRSKATVGVFVIQLIFALIGLYTSVVWVVDYFG